MIDYAQAPDLTKNPPILTGEAIDIFRIAKKLNLTKRSYAWIVAQSVVGPNENERAPSEFHPGLLGNVQ